MGFPTPWSHIIPSDRAGGKNHFHILLQDTDSKGNLCNITQTNLIDISAKPDVIEHVHVGKNYSADESEAYKELFKKLCDIFA